MSRIDARIQTDLPGRILFPQRPGKEAKPTRVRNLSLSGALLENFNGTPEEGFSLLLQIPGTGEVSLPGEAVRGAGPSKAIRLVGSEPKNLEALWSLIRENLPIRGTCLYCGKALNSQKNHCPKCGLYLEFQDESYLEKHFSQTSGERLRLRLAQLDFAQLCKVAHFIDGELRPMDQAQINEEYVGTCPGMLEVFSMLRKVAPTDMNVLILGESGTGKELTAQAIHERSPRCDRPFVAINCAAIPEGLLEAELFGHEKGAFTGAHTTRKGKFEIAEGGTLFLDEIGDLSPGLQAKLLRFLEDRVIERVGGKGGKKVDVRFVAATNCELQRAVEAGQFRMDLFFRLNAFTIKIPPLRERGEDKLILAKYFLDRFSPKGNGIGKEFSPAAMAAIRSYPWPGNVRELINKVRRALVMATGGKIEPADLELSGRGLTEDPTSLKAQVAQTRRDLVLEALTINNFVIARAARSLNISRPSLYALIRKYDIPMPLKK